MSDNSQQAMAGQDNSGVVVSGYPQQTDPAVMAAQSPQVQAPPEPPDDDPPDVPGDPPEPPDDVSVGPDAPPPALPEEAPPEPTFDAGMGALYVAGHKAEDLAAHLGAMLEHVKEWIEWRLARKPEGNG